MEYFSILKDSDIFENPLPEPKEYTPRPTVKGIVLDNEGKIALLRTPTHSLFPGGGVEESETYEEAFIRECKEEIGCSVEIISVLGKALQIRAKDAKRYEIEFLIAKLIGEKDVPTTTQEDERGCVVDWLTPEEVLMTLESHLHIMVDDIVYVPRFNYLLHLAAFKEYLKLKK